MSKRLKHALTTRAETAHSHALSGAYRAMRAGDLVTAERWMRLAERAYRCAEYAEKNALRWRKMLEEIKARRRERIPVHRKTGAQSDQVADLGGQNARPIKNLEPRSDSIGSGIGSGEQAPPDPNA
jgi:hypothetical protein